MVDQLPAQFGKYTLLRKIDQGGMAEIYLALQSGPKGFSKLLVIKKILPDLVQNRAMFGEMLLDEARIAATLTHPNIIQIYDVGTINGDHFIAMEYLAGENVRTVAKALRAAGQWFDLAQALTIVMRVAEGLHYAHHKEFGGQPLQIVHRDVSPKNMLISYDGAVKLLDFGIAKASNKMSEETRAGLLKGSLPYMSPEQARSQAVDLRSDIFSLGIVLFELTTRRRLFRHASDFDVLKHIVDGEIPPPSTLVPGYPEALEKIVLKALARPLEERYQTAAQLHDDLESFTRSEGIVTTGRSLQTLMHGLFAERIATLKEAERLGRNYADAFPDPVPDGGESDSALAVSRTPTSRQIPSPRRRRWPLWAAALTVVAGATVLALVLGSGGAKGGGSEVRAARGGTGPLGTTAQAGTSAKAGEARSGDARPAPDGEAKAANGVATNGAAGQGVSADGALAGGASAGGASAGGASAGGASAGGGPAADAEVATPASRKVTLEVETSPKGAKIYLGDKVLGTSPAKVELDASDRELTLELKLNGYQTFTQKWVPNKDARIVVSLPAQPRRRRSSGAADEIVDPWK